MLVRIGISDNFARYGAVVADMGATGLVSANGLRLRDRGWFRTPPRDFFGGLEDVALDSAGFVAMMQYGGYPWSIPDYVRLARSFPWAWWASMDFCCEPEIARDRKEIGRRVDLTVRRLGEVEAEARAQGAKPPMPVLQGREPDDYRRCADAMNKGSGLMGVGSVCRRDAAGPDGVVAIAEALDRHLPKGVTLHLFGVKSEVIGALMNWSRIVSVDSMAWNFRARKDAREKDVSCSVDFRSKHMRKWYAKQKWAARGARPVQLEMV